MPPTHRISTRSEDNLSDGIFIVGELSNFDISFPQNVWPAPVGGTEPERILDLETKAAAFLDAQLGAARVSQRVRIRIRTLTPLDFDIGIFASGRIPPTWWI